MWRNKKVVIGMVLTAVVLLGSVGAVTLAADGGSDNPPAARGDELLGRVCEIYQETTGGSIDPEALRDAFAQARDEMCSEARQRHSQNLVSYG